MMKLETAIPTSVAFAPAVDAKIRQKIERDMRAVKGPTNPPTDKIRLPRPYKTPAGLTLDAFRAFVDRNSTDAAGRDLAESKGVKYRQVGPSHHLDFTDGHAAMLAPVSDLTNRTAEPLRYFVDVDAPIAFELTPAFWQAYSRVRTCRSVRTGDRVPVVRIESGDHGIRLRASDGDGNEASECYDTTPGPAFAIGIDDGYMWPLRGMSGQVRQAEPNKVCYFDLADGLAPVIVMPVKF